MITFDKLKIPLEIREKLELAENKDYVFILYKWEVALRGYKENLKVWAMTNSDIYGLITQIEEIDLLHRKTKETRDIIPYLNKITN